MMTQQRSIHIFEKLTLDFFDILSSLLMCELMNEL
jgi:hypothetical protein